MVQLREEGNHFDAQFGQVIAVRIANAFDQPFQAQSAQVVGHLSAGIPLQHPFQALSHSHPQAAISDFFGNVGMACQDFQNRHETRIGKAQRRGPLTVLRQGGLAQLAHRLEGEKTILANLLLV